MLLPIAFSNMVQRARISKLMVSRLPCRCTSCRCLACSGFFYSSWQKSQMTMAMSGTFWRFGLFVCWDMANRRLTQPSVCWRIGAARNDGRSNGYLFTDALGMRVQCLFWRFIAWSAILAVLARAWLLINGLKPLVKVEKLEALACRFGNVFNVIRWSSTKACTLICAPDSDPIPPDPTRSSPIRSHLLHRSKICYKYTVEHRYRTVPLRPENLSLLSGSSLYRGNIQRL